jgi:hypothetical protein
MGGGGDGYGWSAGALGNGHGRSEQLLGYAPSTVARHMQVVGRLSRFLQQRGLAARELDAGVLEEFFDNLHTHHGSSWPTAKSLAWLVDYLRLVGVTPATPASLPKSAQEELIDRYRTYLVKERGLARETVTAHERTAQLFLAKHSGCELHDLDAGMVSRFVTGQCRRSIEHLRIKSTAQSLIPDVDRLMSGSVQVIAYTRREVLVDEKSHAGGRSG